MMIKKSEYVKRFTVGVNDDTPVLGERSDARTTDLHRSPVHENESRGSPRHRTVETARREQESPPFSPQAPETAAPQPTHPKV